MLPILNRAESVLGSKSRLALWVFRNRADTRVIVSQIHCVALQHRGQPAGRARNFWKGRLKRKSSSPRYSLNRFSDFHVFTYRKSPRTRSSVIQAWFFGRRNCTPAGSRYRIWGLLPEDKALVEPCRWLRRMIAFFSGIFSRHELIYSLFHHLDGYGLKTLVLRAVSSRYPETAEQIT